jgi:hypothetical protein
VGFFFPPYHPPFPAHFLSRASAGSVGISQAAGERTDPALAWLALALLLTASLLVPALTIPDPDPDPDPDPSSLSPSSSSSAPFDPPLLLGPASVYSEVFVGAVSGVAMALLTASLSLHGPGAGLAWWVHATGLFGLAAWERGILAVCLGACAVDVWAACALVSDSAALERAARVLGHLNELTLALLVLPVYIFDPFLSSHFPCHLNASCATKRYRATACFSARSGDGRHRKTPANPTPRALGGRTSEPTGCTSAWRGPLQCPCLGTCSVGGSHGYAPANGFAHDDI